jgi:AMP phosphorylase
MSVYLKTKKLDLSTGDPLVILMNEADAKENGFREGQKSVFIWQDIELYTLVNITDTEIAPGEVGLFTELWQQYSIPEGEMVRFEILKRPESIDFIKRKLMGHRLTREEILTIMTDISDRKIREIEVAYFMACFFNPGFDDDEVRFIAEGMAKAGDILSFVNIKDGNKLVVDKHSIGGIAAKGITPILVPIIASAGLVIPNTSTRAITTPAGTTDILEVLMPVSFSNEQLMSVVKETGACMIWGGSLKLAPADDVMISVERELEGQSYSKLIASIVAKKISMGVTHIVIDIPYGKAAKVKSPEDAQRLSKQFIKIFNLVGIQCETFLRFVNSPDGNGVGPVLEVRDILKVLEQKPNRPMALEKVAVEMAGRLFEMSGKADFGKGRKLAREQLESGKALSKFWEIAFAQGATEKKTADQLIVGEYSKDFMSNKSGVITFIDNHEVVEICRALGTPFIKEAGLYFHKLVGEYVKEGELLFTIYAATQDRLIVGESEVDVEKMFELK